MNPIPITQDELKQGCLTRRWPVDNNNQYDAVEKQKDGSYLFQEGCQVKPRKPPYLVGDMIPALEEWGKGSWWSHSEHKYYTWVDFKYDAMDHLKEFGEWQPAETMPVKLSQSDLRVTEVDCKKLGGLTSDDMRKDLGISFGVHHTSKLERSYHIKIEHSYIERWNQTHPEHPYDPDMHSFGVKFEIVKKESEK